ncbi:MAG: pilus assembly protein TadG-related protein [Marivita sp.]
MMQGKPKTAQLCRHGLGANRFWRDEQGSVTIFVVLLTMVMVSLGGLAVDVIRFESQRAQLQSVIDRAVLSAAGTANDEAEVSSIVTQYLTAQNITPSRLTPDYFIQDGRRITGVRVEQDVRTYFLRYFGFNTLRAEANSRAEQNIRSVEISLVLDRSGSMLDNSKLDWMKTAATNFVTEMLGNNRSSDVVSISVIPFNDRIVAGTAVAGVFNFTEEHSFSTCAKFPDDSFSSVAVTPFDPIERTMHFDYIYQYNWIPFAQAYCPTDDVNAILPWSNNEAEINAHIQGLVAEGFARPDQALKWGAALLDPAAQPAAAVLASDGEIPASFANRPTAYSNDALKVIVLIADGMASGESPDVAQQFKRGFAPIYRFEAGGVVRWSTYHAAAGRYYVTSGAAPFDTAGTWQSEPFGGAAAQQLTWPELWATRTSRSILFDFYYPMTIRAALDGLVGWGNAYDAYFNFSDNAISLADTTARSNQNFETLCAAAAARDIVIFTISLDATESDAAILQNCAATTSNHYLTRSSNLTDAFASISEAIGMLRLIE